MAGAVGRKLLLKKNDVVLAGVRTKGFAWGGESIDISSGEDNGIRLLLADSAQEQIDLTVEGLMKGTTLRALIMNTSTSRMLTDITLEWPLETGQTNPATLEGNFRISAYEEGAPYNEAITFSATLESSGAWTYTAGS